VQGTVTAAGLRAAVWARNSTAHILCCVLGIVLFLLLASIKYHVLLLLFICAAV
jgi:hypothetical protein